MPHECLDYVDPEFARNLELELADVLSDTTYYIRKELIEELKLELEEVKARDTAHREMARLQLKNQQLKIDELVRLSLRMVQIFDDCGDEITAKQFRKAIKETLNL